MRLAWAVALGTIPVAVAGLLAYRLVASAARNPLVIASTSIGFGLALWWADRAGSRRRTLDELTWWDTAVVGCAQALALIPGTSRSGITITAGLGQGFTREDAARFSFLLYVPVGVLAAGRQLLEVASDGFQVASLGPTLVGFAVSAVSAYVAIGALLAWVRSQSLTVFVVYRVVLGLVILAVVFLGVPVKFRSAGRARSRGPACARLLAAEQALLQLAWSPGARRSRRRTGRRRSPCLRSCPCPGP